MMGRDDPCGVIPEAHLFQEGVALESGPGFDSRAMGGYGQAGRCAGDVKGGACFHGMALLVIRVWAQPVVDMGSGQGQLEGARRQDRMCSRAVESTPAE